MSHLARSRPGLSRQPVSRRAAGQPPERRCGRRPPHASPLPPRLPRRRRFRRDARQDRPPRGYGRLRPRPLAGPTGDRARRLATPRRRSPPPSPSTTCRCRSTRPTRRTRTGGQPLDVPFPRAGQRLVGVVDVEDQVALPGSRRCRSLTGARRRTPGRPGPTPGGGQVAGHRQGCAAEIAERGGHHPAVADRHQLRHPRRRLLVQQADRVGPVRRRVEPPHDSHGAPQPAPPTGGQRARPGSALPPRPAGTAAPDTADVRPWPIFGSSPQAAGRAGTGRRSLTRGWSSWRTVTHVSPGRITGDFFPAESLLSWEAMLGPPEGRTGQRRQTGSYVRQFRHPAGGHVLEVGTVRIRVLEDGSPTAEFRS